MHEIFVVMKIEDVKREESQEKLHDAMTMVTPDVAPRKNMHVVLVGPAWSRAFRCLWMLEELSLSNNSSCVVKFTQLETARPASRLARKFNPHTGKVPVLLEYNDHDVYAKAIEGADVDGLPAQPSLVLPESVAINTYLGDCFPQSNLVPRPGTRQRGMYDSLVCGVLSELDAQALWIHRKHHDMGKLFGHIPEAVTHAQEQFHRANQRYITVLEKMHQHYGNNEQRPFFLLGGASQFSAADILYCHCIDWAFSIGWLNKDSNVPSSLRSYRDACHARPSYQRAQARRQQSLQSLNSNQRKRRQASKL